MNSAFRLINSNSRVNSNFFIVFNFYQNKRYLNESLRVCLALNLKSQLILLFNLFLLLFMSLTVLFQLSFTFIYSTFSKKISVSVK